MYVRTKCVHPEHVYYDFGLIYVNTELMRILPSLRVHLVRVQFKAFASVSDHQYVSKFDHIANAIIARDPDAAEARMREYFQTMMENMAALPDRAFSSR